MAFDEALVIGGILTYVGVLIYLANQVDLARATGTDAGWRGAVLRWLLYGLIGMLFLLGLNIMMLSFAPPPETPGENGAAISFEASLVALAVAWTVGLISWRLMVDEGLRQRFQILVGRWGGKYEPTSNVHLVAAVLMLAMLAQTTFLVILMAQTVPPPAEVVFQAVLEILAALLGVGLAIRRGWPEAAQRLGLRLPTRQDWIWGIGIGLGCFALSRVILLILLTLFSPEWLAEQSAASDLLANSFATLPLAFLLATSAAFGEEIWVRGALQPVFGLLVSSIFFTILHIQVVLTPAVVVILAVSLAFGWLRQRYSTTAAIIAHFMYDFIQLALVSLLAGMG